MFIVPKYFKLNEAGFKAILAYSEKLQNRYVRLQKYYFGDHEILKREITAEYSDFNNQLVINHAELISDTNVGYFMGIPVEYDVPTKMKLDPVLDIYRQYDVAKTDLDLALESSIYGHSYEYVYADENNDPRSIAFEPLNCLIGYEPSVQHQKVFGIKWEEIKNDNDGVEETNYRILFVDRVNIINYELIGGVLSVKSKRRHGFDDVPMIEYPNVSKLKGDFESVISLIDAYNLIQSDRVNDKEAFVDAILMISGATLSKANLTGLKELRVLHGVNEKTRAEYITKNLDEEKMDTLRKVIEDDIFKISATPNFSDRNFIGNSTGVALKFKLLSFEQKAKNKERCFDRALRERLRLYISYKQKFKTIRNIFGSNNINLSKINLIFNRNLPTNDYEVSQMLANLAGIISHKTSVGQLSFVSNPEEEVKRAREDYPPEPTLDQQLGEQEIYNPDDEPDDSE